MRTIALSIVLSVFLSVGSLQSVHAVPFESRSDQGGPFSPDLEQGTDQPPLVRVPEADRARAALEKGRWAEAYRQAVQVMAQGISDVDALGALAVSAAMLGEQTMREAAMDRLLQVENQPRYYYSLAQGIVDLTNRKTQAAEQRFSAILTRTPNDYLALFLHGQAQEQEGRPADALRDYEAALKAQPDFSPALVTAAQLHSAAGAHEEAVALMERAVALEPTSQAFRKVMEGIYERAGLQDKARQTVARSLKYLPGARDSQIFIAWNLLRAGRPADAQRQMAETADLYGPDPQDHLLLAMAAADLRQDAEVTKQVTEYLRFKGRDPEGVSAASLVYLSLGDGKEAIRLFESAGVDASADARASVNLALARQLAGQLDQAAALLDRAAAAGMPPELLALLSANLDLAKGDLTGYRSALSEADGLVPGLASVSLAAVPKLPADQRAALAGWRNVAILMLNNRWIIPVERMADQALAVSPDDPLALYLKGLALKVTGRLEDAAVVLRRVAQLEPGFLSANLELASTLLQLHQPAEATAILEQVEPTARSGPALFQLAIIQQQAGNGAQARVLLDRALKTADQGSWRREAERLQSGKVETTEKGNAP